MRDEITETEALASNYFFVLRCQPTVASRLLNDALGPFRDSRDSGDLIFTPIALLLGLSLPVWNFGYLPTYSYGNDECFFSQVF